MSDLPPAVAAIVGAVAAIACPVERAIAAALLTKRLPKIRREALQEARSIRRVADIAERSKVTPGRIYQLTNSRPATQEAS